VITGKLSFELVAGIYVMHVVAMSGRTLNTFLRSDAAVARFFRWY